MTISARVFGAVLSVCGAAIMLMPSYANVKVEKAQPHTRAYVIKDFPVYRKTAGGEYVADTSLLVLLTQMTIGDTPGFKVQSSGTNALIVRAIPTAHDKLGDTLYRLSKSNRTEKAGNETKKTQKKQQK